jgi:hypothetical protein
MALKDAQDAAMMAASAAMAAVGGAVDPVARGNAYDYAKMAHDASEAAQAATTSAMAEEYQMTAEAARNKAMEAAMERSLGITALANKIINQSDIDNAVLEGKTGDAVPKKLSNLKARVGAALDLTATIAPTAATTPAVADGAAEVEMGTVHQGAVTSTRATMGASGLRLSVTRGTEAVLRGENPTSLMTSGEKPSGGWPGAELVRTDVDTPGKTYVNVYSDINPPTQQYTVVLTNLTTALAGLPAGAVARLTGEVPGDGSSFAGTYNSNSLDNNPAMAGQFNCPAGATGGCSISVEDGVITAIQGYQFHPAAGVTKPDADYMSWGVWLTVPNAVPTDGSPNLATAGAFASGNQPFSVRAALKGTATYNGDATGLYAAGGYVDYFDADVSLEANFGGTEGADSTAETDANDMFLLGVVTGTVSNINAGGIAVDGSLMLGRATVTADGDNAANPGTGGFAGKTSGTLAGRAMAGNWGGQFFGPSSATGTAAESQYPTTAAGTFGATAPGNVNDPVRILGAFGAWKAE